MISAFKSFCALLAFVAAASVRGAEASTCTSSEVIDTDTALASDTGVAASTYCASETCVSDCIAALEDLAYYLPDCDYTDNINYYETIAQTIASCDTSETTSSDTTTESSVCSTSEDTDVETYRSDYGDALGAFCDAEMCSSDCISTLTELVVYLPNCVSSDGTNYFEEYA